MGSKKPRTQVIADTDSSQPPKHTKFPVVGVGGSAGGLEACSALLRALPTDLGMAFVVVPHLDPARESAFCEILARTTAMPVMDVIDGKKAVPNHVYVLPPNCEITIANGVLHLGHLAQPRPITRTIDVFLRSLAADQGSNAIGVVLSGTASDGTIGLSAIKNEGGITFAQDSSAKYQGMPASAIAAGCVDFVLPPEGIAKELTRIARHPYLRDGGMDLKMIGHNKESQMAQIFSILRRATRVDFSEYKPPTVSRRMARRMALHKIEKLGDYVALLRKERNEVTALYEDLLINVTSFFRDPPAFEVLKEAVYPELLKQHRHGNAPIRIWVPGCSSGEETYSHAISLLEFLTDERTEVPIQIFGTDLSEAAIQRARVGLYGDNIESDVSAIRLRRFFRKIDSGYQISKSIRDLCIFSIQNVFRDPPFSRIDLVSCRNVMIYLSQSLQRRVAPLFHYALNPGGFLMLGNNEGLLGSGAELFELADKKQKLYRKKAVMTPVSVGFAFHDGELRADAPAAAPAQSALETLHVPSDLHREADRLLLAHYSPPSVVVNERLEIIQTRGHTRRFLELPTGTATLDLLRMARPGLLSDLKNAIQEAGKSQTPVIHASVPVDGSDGMSVVTLRVTPFHTPLENNAGFLITFESADGTGPQPAVPEAAAAPPTDSEGTTQERQINQLKQELSSTKEYLQSFIEALESTNEELQSANEEIQSGNEELQSTNEELQTSKEELESANEELHTVNDEMQRRNDLLTQLNNDMNNLLNSVSLPMVMVGPDLGVRRFTPQATRALGVTSSDVGKPLSRIRLNVNIPDLEQTMLDVMASIRPKRSRIRVAGKWYDLRMTPYRTADNRIDGVVLSIPSLDYVQEPDDVIVLKPRSATAKKSRAKKKAASRKSAR
jgi:two-component system, chemotaxis family, CheB/CheR fusion protein